MATLVPVRVRVRMYQVGFGDCFLVTIEYDGAGGNTRAERHILFDCGSTSGPDDRPVNMADIADLIAEHTHGSLDVLVVTHRHRDHLLGFGDTHGAEVFRTLAPKLVLRPWTEDPTLPATADACGVNASRPGPGSSSAGAGMRRSAMSRMPSTPTSRMVA